MKWLERLSSCIDYIEENLKGDIELEELARRSCLSKNYFCRMFQYVTDIPFNEYVRKRRMTLAAKELINSDTKIIDLALSYGYSSSEAFSRAFKQIHGFSPKDARVNKPTLKAYLPLSFQIQIKGDIEMNYKIVKRDRFQVVGVSKEFNTNDGSNFKEIPEFWRKFNCGELNEINCEQLNDYNSKQEIYGICLPKDDGKGDTIDYMIAVPYNGKEINGKLEVKEIPEATWAVFKSIGPLPETLQKTIKRVFTEWLPATKYEIAGIADMEVYPYGDVNSEDYECELWVAVKE
ncbi:AraC family transcriptional regulator [Oceanirhabdus sp. W0125-5]|uniref:AraC family transcriptional regulator n=1 Tax=Oceanirhabdus sp. W0125-5 TaxID=2999116 RepID=UPI0022F3291F|nr:AraC family transcriptional regulator [Oceanirhabdus sp. W0125-5]WBW99309.1 AraC family transcriptional regulator [Oceanirhabdus sp. W0125-5]